MFKGRGNCYQDLENSDLRPVRISDHPATELYQGSIFKHDNAVDILRWICSEPSDSHMNKGMQKTGSEEFVDHRSGACVGVNTDSSPKNLYEAALNQPTDSPGYSQRIPASYSTVSDHGRRSNI